MCAYKTGRGAMQLGQIEARPFVWVTVTTLICIQVYRSLGSTGLTLSHTVIYVLISPMSSFSQPSSPSFFTSPHLSSQRPCSLNKKNQSVFNECLFSSLILNISNPALFPHILRFFLISPFLRQIFHSNLFPSPLFFLYINSQRDK